MRQKKHNKLRDHFESVPMLSAASWLPPYQSFCFSRSVLLLLLAIFFIYTRWAKHSQNSQMQSVTTQHSQIEKFQKIDMERIAVVGPVHFENCCDAYTRLARDKYACEKWYRSDSIIVLGPRVCFLTSRAQCVWMCFVNFLDRRSDRV